MMKKSIDRIDLLAWLLIAGFGMLMVFSLNTTMYYSPDSANYLGWAKSLAFFHGYELRYGPPAMMGIACHFPRMQEHGWCGQYAPKET